jgi:hypothetical protein
MMSRNAVCAAQATARAYVILHLEGRLFGVVDHPEQDGVDVDRHCVGGQRLLRRETGRNGSLIDRRRDAIDERDDPK